MAVQSPVIYIQRVKLIARLKAAHFAKEAARSLGGQIKRISGTQTLSLGQRLGRLNGRSHVLQHIQAMPSSDIAAQAHRDPPVQGLSHRKEPVSRNMLDGIGTICDKNLILCHQVQFLIGDIGAVCHHRRGLPKKAIAVPHIAIKLFLREPVPDHGQVSLSLRHMGLDGKSFLFCLSAQVVQQLLRGRRDKLGTEDISYQVAFPTGPVNQFLRPGDGLPGTLLSLAKGLVV